MECRTAQRLIDRIGGADPALEAHLATCPRCRAYQAAANRRLLDELMAMPPPTSGRHRHRGRVRKTTGRSWWRLPLMILLAGFALLAGYLSGTVGMAFWTIRHNVQAMQIATPPPRILATPGPSPTPPLSVPTAAPTEAALRPPPLASGAVTILLLGIDRRPGESEPSRTDAIAIARLEPAAGRAALLSLPRDLIVPIPGYGQARINAANVYGELYPQLGGGINLTRRTVESLLGIPIDYVVEINFDGFTSAIDAIGGVDLLVEKEIYDPAYPTMDYGYQQVYFAPGMQHMDGANALIYSRVRHGDSDFARMRRQQSVLKATISQVRGRNPLEQVQLIADVSSALRDHIRTDLSESLMASLAWTFRNISPEAVEVYALDETMISMGAPGDPYAQFALPGTISRLADQLMGRR